MLNILTFTIANFVNNGDNNQVTLCGHFLLLIDSFNCLAISFAIIQLSIK